LFVDQTATNRSSCSQEFLLRQRLQQRGSFGSVGDSLEYDPDDPDIDDNDPQDPNTPLPSEQQHQHGRTYASAGVGMGITGSFFSSSYGGGSGGASGGGSPTRQGGLASPLYAGK